MMLRALDAARAPIRYRSDAAIWDTERYRAVSRSRVCPSNPREIGTFRNRQPGP